MASNNEIKVNLAVTDDGGTLKKRNQEAKDLNNNLTSAARMADKAMRPRAGYRQVSENERRDYNAGRAFGKGTGAGARDFAKESQGLGGLVRLYATYAANLFAVSAAFAALKNAADTTIMVASLDKLGASSGVALGGLAKQLATSTDNAISLREAMEATAKATGAGLSKDQLMALGKVAQGASQALGIGMSDALSRLTRGITKLEPELLDELGIFTKVGKATETYAKSVNKSVDSLTDFEKRQAFANAVLKEGNEKFGELGELVNPYDKLLASLSNVAQKILEVINVGLKPLAALFANNAGLIGGAIALIGAKIVQQALPALLSWRKGLADAAKAAAEKSSEINTAFGENIVDRVTAQFNTPKLQKELNVATAAYSAAVKSFITTDNNYKGKSSILESLKAGEELNDSQLRTLQKDISKRSKDATEDNKRHAASAQLIVDRYKDMAAASKNAAEADKILHAPIKYGSEEWQRQELSRKARSRSASLNLLSGNDEDPNSGIVNKVQLHGLKQGLKDFYGEVNSTKNLTGFDKLKTKAVGTFMAIGTAAKIAMSAFSWIFDIIQIASVVFLALDAALAKNDKELAEFSNSVDSLSESVKIATEVSKKYSTAAFDTSAVIAYGNAVAGVSGDISKLVNGLESADKAASTWDRAIDNIKVIWGGDLANQYKKNLAAGLMGAITAVPEGELKAELEDKLRKSLGSLDFRAALDSLPKGELISKGQELDLLVKDIQKAVGTSKLLAENIKETNKAAQEAYTTLANATFKPTELQTYTTATVKDLLALQKGFDNAKTAQTQFEAILSGDRKLEFFSPDVASNMQKLVDKYKELKQPTQDFASEVKSAKKRLEELNNVRSYSSLSERRKLMAEQRDLEKRIPDMESRLKRMMGNVSSMLSDVQKAAGELVVAEINNSIDRNLKEASLRITQIKIASQQAALAALPTKTTVSIKEETRLAIEAIKTETALKQVQEDLINSVDALRLEFELQRAEKERDKLEMSPLGRGPGGAEAREATLSQAQRNVDIILAKQTALKSGNIEQLRALYKDNPAELSGIVNRLVNKQVTKAQETQKIAEAGLKGKLAEIDLQTQRTEDEIQRARSAYKNWEEAASMGASELVKAQIKEAALAANAELDKVSAANKLKGTTDKVAAIKESGLGIKSTVVAATLEQLEAEQGIQKELKDQVDATQRRKAGLEVTNAILNDEAAELKSARDYEYEQYQIRSQASKDQIAYSSKLLDLSVANGSVNNDQAVLERYRLTLKSESLTLSDKIAAADQKRKDDLADVEKQIRENGGQETDAFKRRKTDIDNTRILALDAANQEYQAKLKIAGLERDTSLTQYKMYEDMTQVFSKSVDGMTDAFMKFAETGKLSFKDLANSIISDLARIILKAQLVNMVEGMFGKDFASKGGSLLSKLVTVGASATTGVPLGPATGADMDLFYAANAKGNVYDVGLMKFAKGSAFTNSIVDSPTLFKFARGTGLMGEAGPEAIMPLKRDSNGSLGVVAQGTQPKVDVVVNNYSTAQAETRETTDSRGNRKIEVVIGEMVAGEMARTGSPLQQSMQSTFNTRPAIARR